MIGKPEAVKKMHALLTLMTQLVEQGNWSKVRLVDKQIQQLLTSINKMPWYDSFTEQMTHFKAVYKKNLAMINEQQAALKIKMTRHQHDCEGIVAYQQIIEGNS